MTDAVDLTVPGGDLHVLQVELEKAMTQAGAARYQKRVKKQQDRNTEADTAYGHAIIKGKTREVADAITAKLAEANSGKAGRRSSAVRFLDGIEPLNAAFLTLKTLLNSISRPVPMQRVLMRIATMIEDEVRFRALREEDDKLYTRLLEAADKRFAYHVKRGLIIHAANLEGIGWEPWPQVEKVHLGEWLLNRVMETIGLVEVKRVSEGKHNTICYLIPTADTRKWIADKNAAMLDTSAIYEPMVVPPREWSTPFSGGYLTRYVRPLRMIKTRNRNYLEELRNVDMPLVYAGLNAAQATPWQINGELLAVLEQAWGVGLALGKLPPKYDTELPIKPAAGAGDQDWKTWRAQAATVHRANLEIDSKRVQFRIAIDCARRYKDFEAIFLPCQLDFRGRVYVVPSLTPQGPDWMKGMLRFAHGKPIGDEGAKWLAIHLANCGDFAPDDGGVKVSKRTLEERVQWVIDNEDDILAAAMDPLANRWWAEADQPWQFLAACMEWRGYIEEGADFVSRLPIALDGSCSGLQHFSAALRDEIGGEAVNLIPQDRPRDVYAIVADVVNEMMRADLGTEADLRARQWMDFGVDRTVTKRPVMTMPYGSRGFGFRDQVMVDTLRPAFKEAQRGLRAWPFGDDGFAASLYLSQRIEKAVDQVVVKAAEAMKWLKGAATLMATDGLPVRWTTPCGLPVLQPYVESKEQRVETAIAGKRIQLAMAHDTLEIDKRAQAQGVSPNYVHSLDGSHLMLTVVRAVQEGITTFCLVHDSFGTLAADTPRFFQIIREAFVEMYDTVDVLNEFRDELLTQLSPAKHPELPPLPDKGSLELSAVLDSSYCFA